MQLFKTTSSIVPMIAMLILVGCPQSDLYDFDGDGDPDSTDCEPEDPTIYTGAEELCTGGIDEDCDGLIDDDDPDCMDLDGDGFTAAKDCNATAPAINPDAAEDCDDGVDNDCDDLIDGADPDCQGDDDDDDDSSDDDDDTSDDDDDASDDDDDDDTTGEDADGDGWTVADGDCDDTDASVNPGASEVCNDWIDNNCDGTSNGCELSGTISLANADAKLVGESSGDAAGFDVAFAGDTDLDGSSEILVGAVLVGNNSGAVYLVSGAPSGTTSLSTSAAKITGDSNTMLGAMVDSAGDVDADGRADLLVSAGTIYGHVYFHTSPVSGTVGAYPGDGDFVGDANDSAYRVTGVGDVSGDGTPDVLVGAYGSYAGDTCAGAAYLFNGPLGSYVTPASADAVLLGEAAYQYAGESVAGAGDVDGDGLADILVGAPQAGVGTVYLLRAPISGTIDLGLSDARLVGEGIADTGRSLDGGQDMDGDMLPDVLIGAPGSDLGGQNSGVAYIVSGLALGDVDLGTSYVRLIGGAAGSQVGESVAFAGDVNGDGYGDVLVSAHGAGEVLLQYGPLSGDVVLTSPDAVFTEEVAGDLNLCNVAGGEDANGDGFMDLLIGAKQEGTNGSAYLILGMGQ